VLNSYFYDDPLIFEEEKKFIFFEQWLFFGLTIEFEGEGSYVRKFFLGKDVFLRKNQENYAAFLNQCPHRYHPIVKEPYGKTNLVCTYHHWAFKDCGKLKGIPYEKECYQFSDHDLNNITLSKVAVKKVGELLFVNFSKSPMPFEKQFNKSLITEMQAISSSFTQYKKLTVTKKFNWKLIQENLRDGLHPAFLHRKTLLNAIDFGLPSIPKDVPIQFLKLKHASFGGPDVSLTKAFLQQDKFKAPWTCEPKYYNYHVFPSLHLAAPDGGYTFVLEKFIPISPCDTEIEIYFVATQNTLDTDDLNRFFEDLINNALNVYEEDFITLENIQESMLGGDKIQKNGAYERLITRMHKVYLKMLGFRWFMWCIFIRDALKIPTFLLSYLYKIKKD